MLCIRKFMPVPGVSQEPFSPEKPSVTCASFRHTFGAVQPREPFRSH
jgi:hypothetical protein